MALSRDNSNDVSFSLKVMRDGQYLKNSEGASSLGNFVMSCAITEGIGKAGIEAEIVLQDSAGLINSLTGSELWMVTIETVHSKVQYRFQAYSITNRSRANNTEAYIVNCVTSEYISNETTNIFGSSNSLYNKKTKAKSIVEEILQQNIRTAKKLFIEDSNNNHNFIATNWRAFDTIYWIAKRSVRKGNSNRPQNGYLFWENAMGYHFKTIDKIIEDVNNQNESTKSDPSGGKAQLYKYKYEPKRTGDEGDDERRIQSIVFPDDRNYLLSLRNGSWSGFSVGYDPTIMTNSKLSTEAPTTASSYVYNINTEWSNMSHISGGKNPVESFTKDIKQMIETPRRIRYDFLPNRIYDTQNTDNKNYDEIPYLQAYQYLRLQSFKNIQLLVTIPGNVDLYSGYGIHITIPKTRQDGDRFAKDKKYSGKYVIAGLRHLYSGNSLTTEMLLYRDSLPDPS